MPRAQDVPAYVQSTPFKTAIHFANSYVYFTCSLRRTYQDGLSCRWLDLHASRWGRQDELETDYWGAWAYSVEESPIGDLRCLCKFRFGFNVYGLRALDEATLFTAGLRVTQYIINIYL